MNVLIVGLGSIARKHISALRSLEMYDVSLYALRSSQDAGVLEGVYNIYSVDYLAKYSFDFAIISTPTSHHYKAILQLLPYNIPLFIEKPVFESLNYNELVQQVGLSNIKSYVACNLRFIDCLKFTQRYLKDHRVNEVNIYCGSYLPEWRPSQDYRKNYSANRSMGGGVHIDLIHEIDYVSWLFGQPNGVRRTVNSRSSLQIDAIDYANYLFEYDQFCVNIILNYFRRDSRRTLEVVCSDGTLFVDILENQCYWNNEMMFASHQRINDTYRAQMAYFIDEVLNQQSNNSMNTIIEGYNTLKLCLTES